MKGGGGKEGGEKNGSVRTSTRPSTLPYERREGGRERLGGHAHVPDAPLES